MGIEELKAELLRARAIPPPTADDLEALRLHLQSKLGSMRGDLEEAGKWQAIVTDLTSSRLSDLYYAAEGNRGRALTVLGRDHLDEVEQHARDVLARRVPGDFCETGVFRGGISILLAALLKESAPERTLWAADSFAGLPAPDLTRDSAAEIASWIVLDWTGAFATSVAEVSASFRRLDVFSDRVKILEGWFEDTLPDAAIGQLSLLRVDCQYAHSTTTVLTELYPKLSVGGRILLNDYGHSSYWGARTAIDGYREQHGIVDEVHVSGHTAWWQKTA